MLGGRFDLKLPEFKESRLLSLFILLAVSKIVVYIISLGFVYLSGFQPRFDMLFNFDAGFFVGIAERGYYSPETFAFPPLFPLIIRGFAKLYLENYQVAGLFTANLFSFLEIIPAWKLFKYYTDKPGDNMVLWLFFPLYFVWGLIPYTEHVFSFFLLTSWWCIKANKKVLAIAFAALASLARQPGVLLFVPLVLYFAFNERGFYAKIRYTFAAVLVPVAVVLWNLFAGWISGDPLVVVNAQQYYGTYFAIDLIGKFDFKFLIENYSTYTYANHVAMPFLITFVCLACFLLVPKIFKLDKYLAVYTVLNVVLFLGFLPLVSTLRYLSALFPLFLVVNAKVDLKLYLPVCILSSSLMLYSFMLTVFIG